MMSKLENNVYQSKNGETARNDDSQDHLRKLFIGGLAAVTTEDSLRAFYGQWGQVVDVVVMRDPSTKRSRGFGFVSYSSITSVDKAQSSRPHVIDGKVVDSKRALPRPEAGNPESSNSVKKIFVGGLKENHDEQTLKDHFSQFGNVVSVKILTDKVTGRKRGFAFIEYDDYDAVDKAVLYKNHTIKYVLVDVKKSAYKSELAKKLVSQQPQAGVISTAGISPISGSYQQSSTTYNQHGAYPYPAPAPVYNGWSGYSHTAATYHQSPQSGGYGAYGAPLQNSSTPWTTYTAPNNWSQNNYSTSVSPNSQPSSVNGWNTTQNFGDYHQSYNGGPQKTGSLQGNRINPYSVSSAPNYSI